MNLSSSRAASVRARESGTIIIVLLILLALFTVITIGSSYSLSRLRKEVLAVEQRQAARIAPRKASSPGSPPTIRPEVPATVAPDATQPNEPAR